MSELQSSSRVSQKLQLMLEEVNQTFGEIKKVKGQAKKAVESAYTKAIEEQFTPQEAAELIFSSAKNVSRRTIYLYLPDEAKDEKMQTLAKSRKKKNRVAICSDIALNNIFALEICERVITNKSKGLGSQFVLTHDGQYVTSIKYYERVEINGLSNDSLERDEIID